MLNHSWAQPSPLILWNCYHDLLLWRCIRYLHPERCGILHLQPAHHSQTHRQHSKIKTSDTHSSTHHLGCLISSASLRARNGSDAQYLTSHKQLFKPFPFHLSISLLISRVSTLLLWHTDYIPCQYRSLFPWAPALQPTRQPPAFLPIS